MKRKLKEKKVEGKHHYRWRRRRTGREVIQCGEEGRKRLNEIRDSDLMIAGKGGRECLEKRGEGKHNCREGGKERGQVGQCGEDGRKKGKRTSGKG